MKTKHNGSKFASLLIALALATGLLHPTAYAAWQNDTLGNILHYNVVVFGDMESRQADAEGAVAVQGNTVFGKPNFGFDIGGADPENTASMGTYRNPNGYPTFLAGGTISSNGIYVGIFNGPVVIKESYKDQFYPVAMNITLSKPTKVVPDSEIETAFREMKSMAAQTGALLQNAAEKGITATQLRYLNKLSLANYENTTIDTEDSLVLIEIAAKDPLTIGEIFLPEDILKYDTVVFTSNAESITFTGGAMFLENTIIDTEALRFIHEKNAVVKDMAQRIIWNFPNAKEVTVNRYGVLGSILAPSAHLTGAGESINGKVIVRSFTQDGGMEPHAFSMSDVWRYKTRTTPANPRVQFLKVDASTDNPLPDAEFSLEFYGKSGWETYNPEPVISGKDGYSDAIELQEGEFRLLEARAPEGYISLDDVIPFSIDASLMPHVEQDNLPKGVTVKVEGTDPAVLIFTVENTPVKETPPPETPPLETPPKETPPPETPPKETPPPETPPKETPPKETPPPETRTPKTPPPDIPNDPTKPNQPVKPENPTQSVIRYDVLDPMPKTGSASQVNVLLYIAVVSGLYIWAMLLNKHLRHKRTKNRK